MYNLGDSLPENVREGHEAAVLHLKGFVDKLLVEEGIAGKLYEEQGTVQYDKKYYDAKKDKTFNKKARYNMVFGDNGQKPS